MMKLFLLSLLLINPIDIFKSDCSMEGYCFSGSCECNPDFYGEFCEEFIQQTGNFEVGYSDDPNPDLNRPGQKREVFSVIQINWRIPTVILKEWGYFPDPPNDPFMEGNPAYFEQHFNVECSDFIYDYENSLFAEMAAVYMVEDPRCEFIRWDKSYCDPMSEMYDSNMADNPDCLGNTTDVFEMHDLPGELFMYEYYDFDITTALDGEVINVILITNDPDGILSGGILDILLNYVLPPIIVAIILCICCIFYIIGCIGCICCCNCVRVKKNVFKGKGNKIAPKMGEKCCIVFTDIENSTLLWDNERITMANAMVLHNKCARLLIKKYKGYEIKTIGDAFMVAFKNPANALMFALNFQNQLAEQPWPSSFYKYDFCKAKFSSKKEVMWNGLKVRIGMDIGLAQVVEGIGGRVDYLGPMVNKAARIESMALGGTILCSQEFLLELIEIREKMKEQYETQFVGEKLLKGIKEPTKIYCLYQRERRFPEEKCTKMMKKKLTSTPVHTQVSSNNQMYYNSQVNQRAPLIMNHNVPNGSPFMPQINPNVITPTLPVLPQFVPQQQNGNEKENVQTKVVNTGVIYQPPSNVYYKEKVVNGENKQMVNTNEKAPIMYSQVNNVQNIPVYNNE